VSWMSVRSERLCYQERGGVGYKEACTVRTTNFISKQQYLLAHCLVSCIGNVFDLCSVWVLFACTRKQVIQVKRKYSPRI
jgi:hypothetical protein